MTTNPINPKQAALHLWKLGANVTAIPAGGKKPAHDWNSAGALWTVERQPVQFVPSLKWNTQRRMFNGKWYEPIETVGFICGVGQDIPWRNFDVDARKGADGEKAPVPRAVLDVMLDALGLPRDYPWAGRSKSGVGWHIDFRCAGDLPVALAEAISDRTAAEGGGAGVKIGIPLEAYVGDADHIELRWENCQTVLPAPTGYNGQLPDSPPAEVTIEQVVNAFYAVATPKLKKRAQRAETTSTSSSKMATKAVGGMHIDVEATQAAIERASFDLVGWFVAELGGETQDEPSGEVRILGHTGLLVKPDTGEWYIHGTGDGGRWVKAIAHTRYNGQMPTGVDYLELLSIAADFAGITPIPSSTIPAVQLKAVPAPPGEGARSPAHEIPSTIYWGDAIDTITLQRPLVKGYLNVGTVALFIGPSEAGKSTIAVDLACKVAAHYSTIYIAGEDAGNVRTQIRAWELTTRHTRGRLGLRDTPLLLANTGDVDAFIAEARPHHPRLIVIDTLSACIPGIDENSSAMTVVTFQLNRIADELAASVLVLHHPTKSDSGTYRGHSSILNNTFTMWLAERDAGDELVTLKVIRHKGKRAEATALRLVLRPTDIADPDEGTLSAPVALPAGRVIQTETYLSARQRAILHYLADLDADGGATVGDIGRTVAAEFKVSEGAVRRDVASLVKRSLMTTTERQREPRTITDKGREMITSDQVDQVDQVRPEGTFVVNINLGLTAEPDHTLISSGATFSPQQEAETLLPQSHLIAPDHTRSDRIPPDDPDLIHRITPFRGDPVDQDRQGGGAESMNTSTPSSRVIPRERAHPPDSISGSAAGDTSAVPDTSPPPSLLHDEEEARYLADLQRQIEAALARKGVLF